MKRVAYSLIAAAVAMALTACDGDDGAQGPAVLKVSRALLAKTVQTALMDRMVLMAQTAQMDKMVLTDRMVKMDKTAKMVVMVVTAYQPCSHRNRPSWC